MIRCHQVSHSIKRCVHRSCQHSLLAVVAKTQLISQAASAVVLFVV